MPNKTKTSFWKNILDTKIGKSISLIAYFKQSLMATIFLIVFFLGWNAVIPLENQIIFSAVASSTFLTFISASIYDSLSKKIIGGQFVGVMIGLILWHSMHYFMKLMPSYNQEVFIVFLSLSAGLAVLFMSLLNFEHPPAAGTAMAFVFNPNMPVLNDFLFIMVCAILLGSSHKMLKNHHLLKDLQGKDVKKNNGTKFSRVSKFMKNHRK